LIATLDYKGPKGNDFVNCDDPVFTVTDETGANIPFLTAVYNSALETISIVIVEADRPDIPEKGLYALHISFTEPGVYLVDLSLELEVYDICNDSDFPAAPTFLENEYDYWIGQGDLVVSVDWTEDTVSAE